MAAIIELGERRLEKLRQEREAEEARHQFWLNQLAQVRDILNHMPIEYVWKVSNHCQELFDKYEGR